MRDHMHNSPADLIRAFQELAPTDDRTRQAIAALLGIELRPTEEQKPEAVSHAEAPRPDRAPYEGWLADEWQPAEPPPQPSEPPPISAEEAIPSILTPLRPAPQPRPEWLESIEPLMRPAAGREPELPEPEALFHTQWTRGILTMALAIPSKEGPADLEKVIRMIAKGEVLQKLPRLPRPTLARGVQLLIDRSDAMMPFLADLKRIEDDIRRVVGYDRLEVLRFSCCPSRGAGKGSLLTWTKYSDHHTPLPGTRAICITDLGIGNPPDSEVPASTAEWLGFADHLQRAACPLVVLVPYAPSRWPPELARKMNIVHWNHTTSAARVARVVRRQGQPR